MNVHQEGSSGRYRNCALDAGYRGGPRSASLNGQRCGINVALAPASRQEPQQPQIPGQRCAEAPSIDRSRRDRAGRSHALPAAGRMIKREVMSAIEPYRTGGPRRPCSALRNGTCGHTVPRLQQLLSGRMRAVAKPALGSEAWARRPASGRVAPAAVDRAGGVHGHAEGPLNGGAFSRANMTQAELTRTTRRIKTFL